jgi:hypothetical protein
MLRNLKEIMSYVLVTKDGKLDGCSDFLFDDRDWVVRYVVADTRRWLPGRKVLISPMALERPDWQTRHTPVKLTKAEIEASPDLAHDAPVSKTYEKRWHEHYKYSPYWSGARMGSRLMRNLVEREVDADCDEHLRSAVEVSDYHVRAREGQTGYVEDFVVDDETWEIRFIVVSTRRWLHGRNVLVEPASVDVIRWANRMLAVGMTRDELLERPAFDPNMPVNRETETRVYDYRGRPHRNEELEEVPR